VLDLYGASSEPLTEEEMAAACTLSDTAAAYVTAAHDRHARRLAEDELRLQALHDPLTGLPNRLLMLDRLKHALTGVARHPGSVGWLFLDLDGFKQVNDAHGHIAGDQLLVAVAERLTQTLRPTDTLARLGGDEFVVLCEDLHRGGGDLKAIAERVLSGLAAPIALPGHAHAEVLVRASMGAVHPAEDDHPEEVLRHADRAMYVAKRRGGGVAMSDRQLDGVAAAELVTRTQLENALQREELELAFQPVVALNGSQWHGVEALLRWKHPSAGLLSARQFLPVIERTGLMLPIGSWVLQEACRQLPSLQPAGASADWFLSVNVSVSQLLQPSFADEVGRVLERSGTDASRLMLEVTETALLPRSDVLTASLRQLSAMGVRVALDDFGTGYSSMAHLKYLPADVLKIDKMFIDGLGADRRDEAVVRGTITLAHALGLRVIAEGIEDIRQHELLVAAECDAAQGYLYARPEGRQVSV
jgi:diguanylate cyclase (GGDEF)-like protein